MILSNIAEQDRYKSTFTIPYEHYKWNVIPFGLKNAQSEFQNIMNDIFNGSIEFSIVYIDDVLVFSYSLEQHFQHLDKFMKSTKQFKPLPPNSFYCVYGSLFTRGY